MNNNLKQRYCKECNLPVGKGKSLCDQCKKELKKQWYKKNYKLHTGFTMEQENQFLQQCINSGIDTTGLIQKEYKQKGRVVRSQVWIIKRLRELGIYKIPTNDRVVAIRDKELREQTYKLINDLKFTLHTDNIKRKDIKVKCNHCDSVLNWYTMRKHKGCINCKTKDRIQKRIQNEIEKRDNKNSARIKEYTSRVERLKEFIRSEQYKEYTNWKETPLIKEYTFYNDKYSIEYRDKDLTKEIDRINYYVYKTANSKCPDKTRKGLKICNKCIQHKPTKEFKGNQCKDCAKEYRRIHLLPNEIKRTKERYQTDPIFKLNELIRRYLYGALKGKPKTRRIKQILGIEPYEFKQYIENRFEDWMSWDNHGLGEGKWQLQHIIPKDFAINEKESYLINYYKNFIPMCGIQNGILKNRIIKEQMNEWHATDKGIQKIVKRNKDRVITESEFKKMLPVIVRGNRYQ